MADFSLKAVFGMDATGVKTEIKQLRREFNSFAGDIAKLGAGAAVAVFTALSHGAIELAGRLSDTALNIGINVESLQALEAQHKRNGIPAEQLTTTLTKLRLNMERAREGDEKQVEALRKLGIKWTEIAGLPLEEKYAAIAKAQYEAKDKAEAYNAVAEIFGDKVGPRLKASLDELAQDGFPAVMESAQEAGHVMSAETIVALDKAGDAIDDFKKTATIAVGNIIVNFRSEEGLKLLGLQFLKVVGTFGAGIADAIYEAGEIILAVFFGAIKGTINFFRDGFLDAIGFIAEQFNSIVPEWLKKKGITIDVSAIDALKSAGTSIGDEITTAIARTSPSTFKKDVGEFWDKRIGDQKKIVDAMNEVDFGDDAEQLRDAGNEIETSLQDAANGLEDAGESAAESIAEAAEQVAEAFGSITRVGDSYESQSTTALTGVRDRLRQQFDHLNENIDNRTPDRRDPMWYMVKSELAAVEKELGERNAAMALINRLGEEGARYQLGDQAVNKAMQDLSRESTRTANAVEQINRRLGPIFG